MNNTEVIMPSLEYQGITWDLEKFNYADGVSGLRLVNKNVATYITNNMSNFYGEHGTILVRDYGTTKGIYNWLLSNGIIEKYTAEKHIIMDRKAKVCKLLL
jgi:hypothetical protein